MSFHVKSLVNVMWLVVLVTNKMYCCGQCIGLQLDKWVYKPWAVKLTVKQLVLCKLSGVISQNIKFCINNGTSFSLSPAFLVTMISQSHTTHGMDK